MICGREIFDTDVYISIPHQPKVLAKLVGVMPPSLAPPSAGGSLFMLHARARAHSYGPTASHTGHSTGVPTRGVA